MAMKVLRDDCRRGQIQASQPEPHQDALRQQHLIILTRDANKKSTNDQRSGANPQKRSKMTRVEDWAGDYRD